MKKTIVFSVLLMLFILVGTLTACDMDVDPSQGQSESPAKTELAVMENVTFDSETFMYDGTEKTLTIKGAPAGAEIAYTNASQTNAGTYSVQAVVTCDGYKPLTLKATLTITKATLSGISAEATQKVDADTNLHLPAYTGTLPEGVTVQYLLNGEKSDGVIEAGTYNFSLFFSGNNYETLTLNATLDVIESSRAIARRIIAALGTTPDLWSFLPSTLSPEYHTLTTPPNYSSFVSVSSLPANGIGKQMNVICGLLNKANVAVSYVDKVMNVLNTVESLYASFLDTNPEDASVYSGSVAGFNFTLSLEKERYELLASFGSVKVTLYSSLSDSTYGATIRLTETTILKYAVSENNLTIALDILDSMSVMLDLARSANKTVTGMIYEYTSIGGVQLTATSALIEVGEQYTTIIGTKGDFIPTSEGRNCEIYENKTGLLVGTEVREDISDAKDNSKVFNTYWFPLSSLSGVTSIMKEDTANGINLDTIYINNYTKDTMHTKIWVGLPLYKTGTRHFDIEFKTMYFFTYDAQTGKYEDVKCEIPMLFVQQEKMDSFESDFANANKNALSKKNVSLTVSAEEINVIDYAYEALLPQYDARKNAVTHQMIINYCKAN